MGQRGHRLFAAAYDRMTAPLEHAILGERRERLLADLTGDVLDLGAGTGANLPHLRRAARVVAAEPDPAMRARLTAKLAGAAVDRPVPVQVSDAAAESLPYPDATFDTVVCTLVLCTVTDPERALAEARRVLTPTGRLVVLEHVRGTGRLARWQDRLTPVYRRLVAGCHPNRDTRATIERAGFTFERVDTFTIPPGWLPTSPMIEAVTAPAR
jgi:ubiquinone/menaquinone biosynthesis C-methylase UbiE